MGWNELAGNRAVNGDNLVGSGIIAKPGQSLPTGTKAMTRAQANTWLNIQPLPNDNKLVLKQELIAAPILLLAAANTHYGIYDLQACPLVGSGGGRNLYTASGTLDDYQAVYYDRYGIERVFGGTYAYLSGFGGKWVHIGDLQFMQGVITGRGSCNFTVYQILNRQAFNVTAILDPEYGVAGRITGTATLTNWWQLTTISDEAYTRSGEFIADVKSYDRIYGNWKFYASAPVADRRFTMQVRYNNNLIATSPVTTVRSGPNEFIVISADLPTPITIKPNDVLSVTIIPA